MVGACIIMNSRGQRLAVLGTNGKERGEYELEEEVEHRAVLSGFRINLFNLLICKSSPHSSKSCFLSYKSGHSNR